MVTHQHAAFFNFILLHTTVLLHLQDCTKFACQLDLCVARGLGYHDRVDSFAISRMSRQTTVNKKKNLCLAEQTPEPQIVFLRMRYRIKRSALGLRLASNRQPAPFAERARVGDVVKLLSSYS